MSRPAIIITGGARRIGAATARHFAREGYDIVLHYHHSKEEAEALKIELEAYSVQCETFAHDMADVKNMPGLMKKIAGVMPNCVALINNASVFERGTFMETDEALLERQFAVNFKAPFFLTHAFAATFKKGSVINLLDADIVTTKGSHFAYLLSKKTLAEFTAMAARALGPNIRVNGICPGCVLPSNQNEADYEKKLEQQIPLKSHPPVRDIAETALWLTKQSHITGQIIFVDGGQHVL